MHEIICYKTFDGKLFENEDEAKAYTEDKLGEELDGLLKLFKLDVARNQEYRALLQLLKNKKELEKSINAISEILDYEKGGK